jgi:hypothetical protein
LITRAKPGALLAFLLVFVVAKLGDPQPVAARVDDGEATDCSLLPAGSEDARDLGRRQLAIEVPEPGCEVLVQVVGVGHGDDDAPIRLFRVKSVDDKQVNVKVVSRDHGVGVGPVLAVLANESKGLIKGNRFVEIAAGQNRDRDFIDHGSAPSV